jgi:hypothetical protein
VQGAGDVAPSSKRLTNKGFLISLGAVW